MRSTTVTRAFTCKNTSLEQRNNTDPLGFDRKYMTCPRISEGPMKYHDEVVKMREVDTFSMVFHPSSCFAKKYPLSSNSNSNMKHIFYHFINEKKIFLPFFCFIPKLLFLEHTRSTLQLSNLVTATLTTNTHYWKSTTD